jgi:hypothetical protein
MPPPGRDADPSRRFNFVAVKFLVNREKRVYALCWRGMRVELIIKHPAISARVKGLSF